MGSPRKHDGESQLLARYSIGLKLRTLRNDKRMTLAHLGVETGLSTALLSKLETEHMIPTLPTLAKICRTFGVGLGFFFSDENRQSISITRKAQILGPARGQQPVKSLALHMSEADDALTAEILEFPPDISSIIGTPGEETEIAAYLIDGTLQVNIAGSRETLNAGDCLVMNTSASVIWNASSNSNCRVFVVSGTWRGQHALRDAPGRRGGRDEPVPKNVRRALK